MKDDSDDLSNDGTSDPDLTQDHVGPLPSSSLEPTRRRGDTSQTHIRRSDSLEDETLVVGSEQGREFLHFHLIRRIGQGGFGSVYLANDTRLNRKVAVKVSNRVSSNSGDGYCSGVIREARAATKLKHPNIVPVYEVAEHESRPFIVAAFIDGTTLSKCIREKRLTFTKAASDVV